jgi:hypothetical protein
MECTYYVGIRLLHVVIRSGRPSNRNQVLRTSYLAFAKLCVASDNLNEGFGIRSSMQSSQDCACPLSCKRTGTHDMGPIIDAQVGRSDRKARDRIWK